ncbi:MAG: hypothetical protein C0604_03450 [Clostridiales bacterium]|nr:MAG: hypothetical protein C0604_03450 [Clostridiales bacterium]
MGKKGKRKFAALVVSILVLAAMTLGALAITYEPGSENDPVVTLSYVESRLSEIVSDFQEKLDTIETGSENPVSQQATPGDESGFEPILIKAGSIVYFGGNTQVILRSGEMKAIANAAGNGLADLTYGKDLKTGEQIQMNHLILVPRNDGRGADVSEDSWVMVKGEYILN